MSDTKPTPLVSDERIKNDKMKTVREALEEAIAIDRRDNGGDPSMYTTQLEAAIAALDAMEAEEGEVVSKEEMRAEVFRVLSAIDEANHFSQAQWNAARELGYNLDF